MTISGTVPWWAWLPQGGDGTVDDGDADDDTGDGDDQDDAVDDGDGTEDDGQTVPKSQLTALQAQFDRLKKHLKASDRGKSATQKQLDDVLRKEKTDLENAQSDLKKATEDGAQWQKRFESLAVTNAFLIDSARAKISWHDPVVAQAALDMSDVEIDEDGRVDGMAERIKKLAKEKPFLVNTATADGTDDEKEKEKTRPPSGSPVGSGAKNKGKPGGKKQYTDEELLARFPALKR